VGIFGRWFVATDDEASAVWTVEKSRGMNPFTREIVEADRVRLKDNVIAALPTVYEKWLLAHHVAALFGIEARLPTAIPTLEGDETELVRVPNDALRAVVAAYDASTPLAPGWMERLRRARGAEFSRFDEGIVSEDLAKSLARLASIAVSQGATIWGTFE
jgi:hypothetical protein